jgi:hypothetical protein
LRESERSKLNLLENLTLSSDKMYMGAHDNRPSDLIVFQL